MVTIASNLRKIKLFLKRLLILFVIHPDFPKLLTYNIDFPSADLMVTGLCFTFRFNLSVLFVCEAAGMVNIFIVPLSSLCNLFFIIFYHFFFEFCTYLFYVNCCN